MRNRDGAIRRKGGTDIVKVTLSTQEKLKGMKYSTVKDRRQFLIHRIRHLQPEKRAKKKRVTEKERER